MTDALTLAIIGHLVGDYLLQNDWMALNKKKCTLPCAVHCFLWTLAVCLFAGWPFSQLFVVARGLNHVHAIEIPSLVAVVLFVTHFIQDRTQIIGWWMRLKWKDQSKFAEPPMGPWSLIVVDNVWHIVTIWAVWRFIV